MEQRNKTQRKPIKIKDLQVFMYNKFAPQTAASKPISTAFLPINVNLIKVHVNLPHRKRKQNPSNVNQM